MKKYFTLDNWNGENGPFDTVEEAKAHAEKLIPQIRLTKSEFIRYRNECENFICILENDETIDAVEITAVKLGRFY